MAQQASERFWFMTGSATVRLSQGSNPDGLTILEHECLAGFGPPLHVHRAEDETFYVLEGEILFAANGERFVAGAGTTVLLPRAVPHGFRVQSPRARFLTLTHGPFERLIRAGGLRPTRDGLPDQTPPSLAEQAAFAATCAAHGIDLIGPPIE